MLSTVQYYDDLYNTVNGKVNAGFGFNSSLTDYWGHALSYQLVNASDGGPGTALKKLQVLVYLNG